MADDRLAGPVVRAAQDAGLEDRAGSGAGPDVGSAARRDGGRRRLRAALRPCSRGRGVSHGTRSLWRRLAGDSAR